MNTTYQVSSGLLGVSRDHELIEKGSLVHGSVSTPGFVLRGVFQAVRMTVVSLSIDQLSIIQD